jgi:hypothetical protein
VTTSETRRLKDSKRHQQHDTPGSVAAGVMCIAQLLKMSAMTGKRRLGVSEVERVFVQCAVDLREILILDGIDVIDDPSGFRIRCHDLYGPLPDVAIEDTGDRYPVLDRIIREAATRVAMARIRKALADMLPGCQFLLPTSTGQGALVGIRSGGRTVLAEGPTFSEAYHELSHKVFGERTSPDNHDS